MPVREHDQLVVLYSKEAGKLKATARGSLRINSKQALALDDGNLIHCELVQGKAGPIMTGAQAVQTYSSAKTSPLRWAAAQFFLQAIDSLVFDEQPDNQLWSCLNDCLARLDSAPDNETVAIFRRCQGRLLESLGYGVPGDVSMASEQTNRGALDSQFEEIAQRRLTALDLFYEVAARRTMW